MLTTTGLLEKSDEDLHKYVISVSEDQLQALFAEAWETIRQMPFFGGQPTSAATNEALNISRLVVSIARHSANDALISEGHRMMAYVLNACEQYEQAILEYVQAIPMLESQGHHQKAARTRLGLVAAMFMTGRYTEALKEAERADEWFTSNGDEDGRAKLLVNLGNLHHRMDQHAQAVEYHESAIKAFRKLKNAAALAPCFLNLADSLSCLDRFEEADRSFEKSERLCRKFGLTELGFQARYNRAYLSFLRGRYSEAIQNFGALRRHFNEKGSQRHSALCDLDESEIYLHLNLTSEALNLSRRAAESFNALGMKYEEAKARAFAGIGLTNGNQPADALPVLADSQAIFEQEENLYWVASIELYRAQILFVMGRQWEAQALALSASERFSTLSIPSKQAIALTLLARISLELGNVENAKRYAQNILRLIEETPIPLHVFPCYFIIAKVGEHTGDLTNAYEFYKRAAHEIEVQRGHLHYDELRVTFLKGKQQVYEALVRLALAAGTPRDSAVEAYGWCERGKSRGLVDLLSQHSSSVQPQGDRSLLLRVQHLHEELNSYQIRANSADKSRALPSGQDIELKKEELARNLKELSKQNPEYASLQSVTTVSVEDVQSFLPSHSSVVEYFIARDEVLAFVISKGGLIVRRHLCTLNRLHHLHERFRLQIEKFQFGPKYVEEFKHQLQESMDRHLQELYTELILPLEDDLRSPHLIIVPHGVLHYLPFHAFFDGDEYLIDRHTISYAPSASVLKFCMTRNPVESCPPVIAGVADDRAPLIADEIARLKTIAPDACTYFGEDATQSAIRNAVTQADFVHLATHAFFRTDNPMLSAFKLSDGWMTALDLYSIQCRTNLVTLSGCKSGVGALPDADELLGLMRGFLYAGAHSLQLSLWDVNDQATCTYMAAFYERWRSGLSKAEAVRAAAQTVRASHPHPYYWAAFSLIGNP